MTTVIKQPEMKSPDILIIDGEHAIHRAFHAYSELHTTTGLGSGAFYGFLSIVNRQVQILKPKGIIIVWGHVNSGKKRKEIYSEYKTGRVHSPVLYKQLTDVQRFLACMGWTQYYNDEGWEADDVIATIVHQYEKDCKIVILSSDHDFLQLVNENVNCLKPGTSKIASKLFDVASTTALWGIPPDQLADMYAIAGEGSDTIIGIPSIAEKTAAKLLIANGPIKNWFNNIDNIIATKREKELLKEHKDRLVRNKKLISLKNSDVAICEIPQRFNLGDGQLILDKYEIKKFTIGDFAIEEYVNN